MVQLTPGAVTPDEPYPDVWQRSHEALAALVPDAESAGITLTVENVWNRFLWSPLEFREYVDSFHNPRVAAYFDIGNVMRYGFPEQWIKLLGRRIQGVHFKDYRLDIDNFGGFTYLLQGDVRWGPVMQALREIGYDGWAVVEVPPYRTCPEQAIFDSAAAMRRWMGMA